MPLSSSKLARALAERIQEILPPPLTASATDARLDLFVDGRFMVGLLAPGFVEDPSDETDAARLEGIARSVMSAAQDVAAEHLALPWPTDANGRMAEDGARVHDGALHLWFGAGEDDAVLTLRPIRLDEVAQ